MARRLGVETKWLRTEAEAGLPHVKAGKTLLFDPATVEQILLSRAGPRARCCWGAGPMTETPLLLSFADAAKLLSISRALLYQLHSDGRLGPQVVKIGRRSLLNRAELQRWVDAGLPPRVQWEARA